MTESGMKALILKGAPGRAFMVLLPAALFLLASTLAAAETVVSLGFDDETASQYQLRDLLRAHGMTATFFVNSSRIGSNGYLTPAQLHELQDDGNEIGGHTLDHLDLTTLDAAEAQRQVCDDRSALLAAGFRVTSFAYPFGAYSAEVEAIVAGCGYASARTVGGVGCSGCDYSESIPPADRYATRTFDSVKDDATLELLQGWVTGAEAHGGGWVQIVMHEICDGCGTYSVSPSILAAFLDWLAPRAAAGTVVKTAGVVFDTEPPQVAITSPRDWSLVSGTTTVKATATDNMGVAAVSFFVDNRLIGTSTTAPYQVNWRSGDDGVGLHRLHAEATDRAGNGARSVTVEVVVGPSL